MAQARHAKTLETWGTLPIASTQIPVRSAIVWISVVVVVINAGIQASTQAIVSLALNGFFVALLTFLCGMTRTVTIRTLGFFFFIGASMMGVASMIANPIMATIGFGSQMRPFLVPIIEDACRTVPLIVFLYSCRKFGTRTLGACDIGLIGASLGAGFAFIEDARLHFLQDAKNPFFYLPATNIVNDHVVAGHAVWGALAAALLGIGLLLKHRKEFAPILMTAGFAWVMLDHVAINYTLVHHDVSAGILSVISANGILSILAFSVTALIAFFLDSWVLFTALPAFPEFGALSRKQRVENLSTFWQSVLDRKRLAFAYFRHLHDATNIDSCKTVAILSQTLINHYHGVAATQRPAASVAQTGAPLAIPKVDAPPAQVQLHDRPGAILNIPPEQQDAIIAGGGKRYGAPASDGNETILGRLEYGGAEGTLNLDDLNKTHTPAPSGTGALVAEFHLPSKYILVNKISEGGMGVIYEARHRHTGAKLAIKVLHPHIAMQPVNVLRFEQEAKAACALSHPNLVIVHDFGVTHESVPYLVMDLIDGVNLLYEVRDVAPLSYERFLNIFCQASSALAHAHARAVVHRDIKPSNILISKDDYGNDIVRIVDFGIAKVLTGEGDGQELTKTGDLVGSPLYMSPEQCLGHPIDGRSDMYSLGCVMYFTVTGIQPFKGSNAVQTIFKHLNRMPERPADHRPDIPDAIEQVIFRCLQKNPDNRYSSCDELLVALQQIRNRV